MAKEKNTVVGEDNSPATLEEAIVIIAEKDEIIQELTKELSVREKVRANAEIIEVDGVQAVVNVKFIQKAGKKIEVATLPVEELKVLLASGVIITKISE